ncbi:MAG: NYN domain-containing protein, partial [Leptospiraceae bacterium]|nr:NYN domain-containing protein [Leptospiraceae bacterium]
KFPELEEMMYCNKLSQARVGLLQVLLKYQKKRSKLEIYAFFDGKKESGSVVRQENLDGIKIFYSHERSADSLIKQFIKENPFPSSLHIVTSDKDILFYCKKFKCNTQTSEIFHDHIVEFFQEKNEFTEKESDRKLDSSEIEFWTAMFKKKSSDKKKL